MHVHICAQEGRRVHRCACSCGQAHVQACVTRMVTRTLCSRVYVLVFVSRAGTRAWTCSCTGSRGCVCGRRPHLRAVLTEQPGRSGLGVRGARLPLPSRASPQEVRGVGQWGPVLRPWAGPQVPSGGLGWPAVSHVLGGASWRGPRVYEPPSLRALTVSSSAYQVACRCPSAPRRTAGAARAPPTRRLPPNAPTT